jgi:hypothetical protein
MNRRNGLTLVEVLTALFILALGVIAILTMFPLGASQMAFAVRDNRSTEAAFNADSYMRTYWKTQFIEPLRQPSLGAYDPAFDALDDPDGPGPAASSLPQAGPNEASYPVVIDPMGYVIGNSPISNPGRSQNWIGDSPTNLPRRNLATIGSTLLAQRTCTLMDTLGYDDFGNPTDEREMRYNWLWIIQRPTNSSKFAAANMTIVVFDRRANLYAPLGSEAVYQNVLATPGTNSLIFGASPDIKPGAWIMDATVYHPLAPTIGRPGIRHANFYRVSAVNGQQVELQSPIKTPTDNGGAYNGTFVVLRGVSGVYSRSPLTSGD